MYPYSIGKQYRHSGKPGLTKSVFIAEGSYLTDMYEILTNRLKRQQPLDEQGRKMQIVYTVYMGGKVVRRETHGSLGE